MQKYFAFIKKIADFFKNRGDDDRSLMEKWRDKYRLVIRNDETFEEVTSLKLSPLSVYVFFSSLVVGTAMLVVVLIVYTPLKRYIPGYGDFQRDGEIAALTNKVGEMERELNASRRYTDNFRKLLAGDVSEITKEAVEKKGDVNIATDTGPKNVGRIPEEDQLRNAVDKGAITSEDDAPSLSSIGAGLAPREVSLAQLFFMPPVSGEVTSTFDPGRDHLGVDVAAPKNTAVKAAADGVVISAGYTVETGYSIAIQHPNNVVTMYKHNSVLLKKTGSAVKTGEAIAIIGNSGESTSGPHLHFELWHKGRAVNPSDYINFN
ncbi:MAG: M23 family metallopeptidase [Lewinellaceae bacterium]|nr:M23 family metallopeptidase [Lewinellaceae bacterium]